MSCVPPPPLKQEETSAFLARGSLRCSPRWTLLQARPSSTVLCAPGVTPSGQCET